VATRGLIKGQSMTNLTEHFLKKLMASKHGIHLSAYIENMGILRDVKLQLREAIDTATEILEPAISEHEVKRFLFPIEKLITDERALRNLSSNFALFRTFESFRVVSIPTDIEQICVVSDSFHVKPLLSWMQADPEFLIFTIDKSNVNVYASNGKTVDFIDLYRRSCSITNVNQIDFSDCFDWLNEWLDHNKISASKNIFVATHEKIGQKDLHRIVRPNVFLLSRNTSSHIKNIAEAANRQMKEINEKEIERNLIDFNFATTMELTQNNIADIARCAVKGEIAKLLIAKDVNVFGTVNRSSGKLAINPFQLDHKDDDILDDLAQIVVLNGGKVLAVDKNCIPGKRVAIAIRKQDRKIS